MIYDFEKNTPQIDPESWVAPNAVVIGENDILTTKKYRDVLSDSNLFDSILIDNRNKDFQNIKLLLKIINNKYDLVVDLQNSQRTKKSVRIFVVSYRNNLNLFNYV